MKLKKSFHLEVLPTVNLKISSPYGRSPAMFKLLNQNQQQIMKQRRALMTLRKKIASVMKWRQMMKATVMEMAK